MTNVSVKETPIFGESARPAETVTDLTTLQDEQVNMELYTINDGEIISFPKDINSFIVKKQPVRVNSTSKVTLVACKRQANKNADAVDSWFNLNILTKRDANNQPVQPMWHGLGNSYARLQKLAEVGSIIGKGTKKILAPVFSLDGKREYNVDENNVRHGITKEQEVVLIAEYGK